jgi:hypothetical protein
LKEEKAAKQRVADCESQLAAAQSNEGGARALLLTVVGAVVTLAFPIAGSFFAGAQRASKEEQNKRIEVCNQHRRRGGRASKCVHVTDNNRRRNNDWILPNKT